MCTCRQPSCSTCAPSAGGTLAAIRGRSSLAARVQRLVDKGRQMADDFGMRAYRVELVWGFWSGGERGVGTMRIIKRVELLPRPRVSDLTSVTFAAQNAGVLPVGSIRIDRISTSAYTAEQLSGLSIPCPPNDHQTRLASMREGAPATKAEAIAIESLPAQYEFWWEVMEDGRGAARNEPPRRERYRPFTRPFLRPDKNDWSIVLERMSEDMQRNGQPRPYPLGDD